VRATEGPSQGPPPPGVTEPVTLSDADLARLRGISLDWRDDRWAVTASVTLRARGTPNPDGRLYSADRTLATGRPLFATAERGGSGLAARMLAVNGVRTVLLRDDTATVERAPGVPWEEVDAGVEAAVRGWVLQLGAPMDGDAVPVDFDGFASEVAAVIEERVLPGVHRDGGDIRLVGVDDGVVRVALHGACRTCPSSTATLRLGVERLLREAFPDRIRSVEAV
jgi:Fe-S cluster biogenesis protein NfuA